MDGFCLTKIFDGFFPSLLIQQGNLPRLRFLHNKRQPRVARHTLPPSLAPSAPQARRPAAGRDGRQRARARRKETDGIIRAARCRAGRLCPDAAPPPASPPVRQPRRRRAATWSAIFRGGPTVSRPALNQHRPPCAGVQRPRSSFRSILGRSAARNQR